MNEIERAIYDMVRARRLVAPTRSEIVAGLKGAFARTEVSEAIRSLQRRSILRCDGNVYSVEWWHAPA